jgi:transposase InsO family protein
MSTSSTSTSRLSDSEKLTADNYGSWKLRVYGLMLRTKLWSIVSSNVPTVEEFRAMTSEAKATWDEKDGQALGEIIGSLSTSQLINVNGCRHANEAWIKLDELHRPKSSQSFVYIRTKLDRTRLEETTPGTMQAHIGELRNVMDQLSDLGVSEALSTKAAAVVLLNSIKHSDYQTVVAILSNGPMDDLTFDKVAATLLGEERRLAQQESAPTNSTAKAEAASAATAVVAGAGRGRRGNNNRRPPCGVCGMTNHPTAKCYEVIGYPAGHPRHQNASTNGSSQSPKMGQAQSAFNGCTRVVNDVVKTPEAGPTMPAASTSAALVQMPLDQVTKPTGSTTEACEWLIDSGASMHLCNNRQWFADFQPVTDKKVILGDNRTVPALGCGRIDVDISSFGHKSSGEFNNVLYAPALAVNLLSVSKLTEAGLHLSFHGQHCIIRSQQGSVIARAEKEKTGNLYRLLIRPRLPPSPSANVAQTQTLPEVATISSSQDEQIHLRLAHERLGHLNVKALTQLRADNMATDITWSSSDRTPAAFQCDSCHMNKSHRASMPQAGTQRATQPLELVHSDVCGPLQAQSIGAKAIYFVTFIDDFSRYTVVYPMQRKSEVFDRFVIYKAWAETRTGKRVRCLRSDGGGEYNSKAFDNFMRTYGITRQLTPSYTPEHNGVAERANRTLMEMVRCMLYNARLPYGFWALALSAAAYLRNRSPTRAIQRKTPFEAWSGQKPSHKSLRVFGCLAYVHIPKQTRRKLDNKARPCIFVGYSTEAKAWLCYDPARNITLTSRDVIFVENKPGILFSQSWTQSQSMGNILNEGALDASNASNTSITVEDAPIQSGPLNRFDEGVEAKEGSQPIIPSEEVENDSSHSHMDQEYEQKEEEVKYDNAAQEDDQNDSDDDRLPLSQLLLTHPFQRGRGQDHGPAQPSGNPRRSLRDHVSSRALDAQRRSTNSSLRDNSHAHTALTQSAESQTATNLEPSTFGEAMRRDDRQQWEQAAQEEIESIHDAGTWTLAPLPPGRQAIGCKWVFKLKHKADGSIDRYKARLVAKGFSQREGIDYDETFAPVAKFPAIRALLSLVAHYNLELHQMDVRTAFLNGDLDRDIYMRQPEGFVARGSEHLYCKLRKCLYGLKQASRAWYEKIHQALTNMGFKALSADTCVYLRSQGSILTVIALYVDDLLIASNSLEGLNALKQALSHRFSMKDLGEAHYVLGIQIDRDRAARTLSISQREYVHKVLERFGMSDCKSVVTPLESNVKLTKADCPAPTAVKDTAFIRLYQSAVGAVMYAMMGTRPDIAFAVASLSQFSSNPGQSHWLSLKHVLRYLKGTMDYKLTYGGTTDKSQSLHFHGFCDSDWGSNVDDRRSVTGYVFMLGGGAVSWQSKKQPTVALSSVEAEYMAATQATREAMWWRKLLHELGIQSSPTIIIIRSDSQGSIALSKNPEHHARSKHIDIRHHFVREQVAAGVVALQYVPTQEMLADVLTKPLSRDQHVKLVHEMGVHSV